MAACKYKVRVCLDVDEDSEQEALEIVWVLREFTAMLSAIGVRWGGGIALYEADPETGPRALTPVVNAKGGAS